MGFKLGRRVADTGTMLRAWFRLLSIITAIGLLATVPLSAQARHVVWIVRDGFYAGMVSGSSELAFFHVKHHRVYHLRFSMNVSCHDSSTGQDYNVNFSAGPAMPQGRLIPANGTLRINWTETDSARRGQISAELTFHRHFLASFSVLTDGSIEDCNGFSAVPLQRAHRTPPVPVGP